MKLKFLHKRKEEKQTEEEAFFLPKFIIERSMAIEIVFLVLVLISALMAPDGREIRLPRHGAHHD